MAGGAQLTLLDATMKHLDSAHLHTRISGRTSASNTLPRLSHLQMPTLGLWMKGLLRGQSTKRHFYLLLNEEQGCVSSPDTNHVSRRRKRMTLLDADDKALAL